MKPGLLTDEENKEGTHPMKSGLLGKALVNGARAFFMSSVYNLMSLFFAKYDFAQTSFSLRVSSRLMSFWGEDLDQIRCHSESCVSSLTLA